MVIVDAYQQTVFNTISNHRAWKVDPIGTRTLTEAHGAKLSRLWHWMSVAPFFVVSAFRGEYSYTENLRRTAQLITELRQYNLGGIQLTGHWIETQADGSKENVTEISFFVPLTKHAKFNDTNEDMKIPRFLDIAINIATKFSQEALFFGDTENVYTYNMETEYAELIGNTNTLKTQEDFAETYAFSQLKNRKFNFGFKESYVMDGIRLPNGMINGMTAEALGLWI